MAIGTSLKGRLRNTSLPRSSGLLPLFEAVVNSIQAIDERREPTGPGRIIITVERESGTLFDSLPATPGRTASLPIVGFTIVDNGVGFNEQNLASFSTLDSEYKADQGCRGVGRLLWLKAFERVRIHSTFSLEGGKVERVLSFTDVEGVVQESFMPAPPDAGNRTSVELVAFKKIYQQSSPKTVDTIARYMVEHCLWYFVRAGGAPDIALIDGGSATSLNELFDSMMRSSAQIEHFEIRDQQFDLIHLNLKSTALNVPHVNWCAANRVVTEESISGRIPGLHGALQDADGDFIYAGYLTSPFLDEHVRSERTGFDLPEIKPVDEHLFPEMDSEGSLLSVGEIREEVLTRVETHLRDSLEGARKRSEERVEDFVSSKAPRYRPVMNRLTAEGVSIDPRLGDKELEVELHKHLAKFEHDVLVEGQSVLNENTLGLTEDEYHNRLNDYLAKVEEIKRSDLAAYVSRRRMILDFLAKAIEQDDGGRYVREDLIHNLLMPMQTTSNDHRSPNASNLWIIDERLTFHNFLASDKSLRSLPITDSASTKEPDLLALQTSDSPALVAEGAAPTWASLSVIEIKRPMRTDSGSRDELDPIEQCLDYLQRVRDGRVRTATGRPISNADKIPGFCYVIADLTPALKKRCIMHQLNPTADGLGYFGYHGQFNAYIEVISFDRLLIVARQRNRAFFDVVGLPAD